MHLLIVGFAALQFVLYQRGTDFHIGDAMYVALARSILQEGAYRFNFLYETLFPPGFPLIISTVCATIGCSHAVLVRSMAIFVALGLMTTYELLRRTNGRAVAAGICVVLDSSPVFFAISTRTILSDLPFFSSSMLALLLAARLDSAKRRWGMLAASCGVFLTASILIRSSGIALLAGLLAWLIVSFLFDRQRAAIRLAKFAPVFVAGLIVQALWMQWGMHHPAVPEWPLGGYPGSYLSQLKIKDGNHPELGAASLADLPARVGRNLMAQSSELVGLVTRKGCCRTREWFSPWVFCPVLLILVGLISSIASGGGRLYDWYFSVYMAMYLVWPWNFEARFYLPVAPLACLYLWQGATTLVDWTVHWRRVAAGLGLLTATLCGARAAVYLWRSTDVYFKYDNVVALCFWALLAVLAAITWLEPDRVVALIRAPAGVPTPGGRRGSRTVRLAGLALLAAVVGVGVAMQLALGWENVRFDPTREPTYPNVEAAKWIRGQTPAHSVVMARDQDVLFYYTERKVVWFPPISNPKVLMDGIRRHGVEYIVVIDRGEDSYWQPSEEQCFKQLMVRYPTAFQLVHQGTREQVFEVLSGASPASLFHASIPDTTGPAAGPLALGREIRPGGRFARSAPSTTAGIPTS